MISAGSCGTRSSCPFRSSLAPTGALVAVWAARLRGRWRASASARRGPVLAFLVCVAVSASTQPVLVTTASGLETEAFVLVYFLGFAFFVEALVPWRPAARRRGDVS